MWQCLVQCLAHMFNNVNKKRMIISSIIILSLVTIITVNTYKVLSICWALLQVLYIYWLIDSSYQSYEVGTNCLQFCRWGSRVTEKKSRISHGVSQVGRGKKQNNFARVRLSRVKGTFVILCLLWASQVALVVKNPPWSTGDVRDSG